MNGGSIHTCTSVEAGLAAELPYSQCQSASSLSSEPPLGRNEPWLKSGGSKQRHIYIPLIRAYLHASIHQVWKGPVIWQSLMSQVRERSDSHDHSGLVAVIRLNFTTPLLNPLDIKGMTKAPCKK